MERTKFNKRFTRFKSHYWVRKEEEEEENLKCVSVLYIRYKSNWEEIRNTTVKSLLL